MNAKLLRMYTTYQNRKQFKKIKNNHEAVILNNIYKAAKNGKYSCATCFDRIDDLKTIDDIFLKYIKRKLEKEGFQVKIDLNYGFNVIEVFWSEKKEEMSV